MPGRAEVVFSFAQSGLLLSHDTQAELSLVGVRSCISQGADYGLVRMSMSSWEKNMSVDMVVAKNVNHGS